GSTAVTVQGSTLRSNVAAGIEIGASSGILIGGTAAGVGNVVDGNGNATSTKADGVFIHDQSSNVTVAGNRATRNGANGIHVGNTLANNSLEGIDGGPSSGVTIGGTAAGSGNVLSDNGNVTTSGHGVHLHDGAAGYTLLGNRITGNATQGIRADSAAGIVIGG